MEMLPILDPDTGRVVGFAERVYAGTHGLWHPHVVLVPVRPEDGHVAVQTRSARHAAAGKRDLFGGHVAFDREFLAAMLGEALDLAAVVRETALREADEELRLVGPDGTPTRLVPEALRQVGPVGDLAWDSGTGNRERSTLFVATLPRGATLHKVDLVDGVPTPVEITWLALEGLVAAHAAGQWGFDGAALRVLGRLAEDAVFGQRLREALGAASAGTPG